MTMYKCEGGHTHFLMFVFRLLVIWHKLLPPRRAIVTQFHPFGIACLSAAEYKTFFLTFLLEFLFILAARVYYLVSYNGLNMFKGRVSERGNLRHQQGMGIRRTTVGVALHIVCITAAAVALEILSCAGQSCRCRPYVDPRLIMALAPDDKAPGSSSLHLPKP